MAVGGDGGEGELWDRFTRLDGGASATAAVVAEAVTGDDRFAAKALDDEGSWMPSEGKESDFRRVLYGIVDFSTGLAVELGLS